MSRRKKLTLAGAVTAIAVAAWCAWPYAAEQADGICLADLIERES